MDAYRLLFSPIMLGPIRVPNRVVFSAHLTNYAEGNLPGERLRNYYRERARGGAGLIITEEQSVHPADWAYEKLIHAFDPAVIPHYQALTRAIKAEGSAVFCQVNHNGAQGFSFFNDEPLWGPAPVGDGLFREIPQALHEGQIAEVIAGYGKVAAHVAEGGFDGIELQASHSSILRQFMSPHTNRRSDGWGGDLAGRLRLTMECLRAVRDGAGPGLAVGIRLCTDELIDGGLDIAMVRDIAAMLDNAGLVDFINTSIGTTARLYMVEGPMSVPSGYQAPYTAAVREQVNVPVIAVGRINDPTMADRLLQEGVADMVGVVRAQIADPGWAGKSRVGRAADIRKCIACNQYCIGLMGLNAPLSCIQNPANGSEGTLGEQSYPPAAQPMRVWVVGGGPAGMEAAIVCARHGHDVTLLDRGTALGGMVNHIVRLPQRLEYGDLLRNKTSELKRYGVKVRLETEVTADMVQKARPDAVVVATGGAETRPMHIPGMDGARVRTPLDVLGGQRPHAAHVLVLDETGGPSAAGITEYLLEGGCRITTVSSAFQAAQHLGTTLDLDLWHARLADLEARFGQQVEFITGHIVTNATDAVELMNVFNGQTRALVDVDLIVPVQHTAPQNGLYMALSGHIAHLHRVGEALAPKDVGEAILDGHRAARQLCGVEVNWQ